MNNIDITCSFCGKSHDEVNKIIAGPGVYICDECIQMCSEIIENEQSDELSEEFKTLPKPKEISSYVLYFAKLLKNFQYFLFC